MKVKLLKISFLFLLFCFLFPLIASAQTENQSAKEQTFKAEITEIIEEKDVVRENGSISVMQKLRFKGLEGDWKDQKNVFDGTKYDVIAAKTYKVGDRVIVNYNQDSEGQSMFFVIDYVRQVWVYWLALIFAVVVMAVGRLKGLRALVVLALTFLIILKFIIPRILAGSSPLLVSIIGSLFILILAVYATEGLNRESTLVVASVFISLVVIGLLSVLFTSLTRLTGFASEESLFLIGFANQTINMQGLLLAGIIIGALGVMDDVVITQIALVQELRITNPQLSKKHLYTKAMKVGVSHMASMVNTLFLAYAGASLPLLLLFSMSSSVSLSNALNSETVTTEIVRTLVGSIGLVLSIPISTLLAINFFKKK
ncbi:MAG: YibE/F family protein [bacterium]